MVSFFSAMVVWKPLVCLVALESSLLDPFLQAIAFNAAMAGCGDAGEWSWTLWLFEAAQPIKRSI